MKICGVLSEISKGLHEISSARFILFLSSEIP